MRSTYQRWAMLLALALTPHACWSWGAAGHQTVGAIADRLLAGSAAGQMVTQTLQGQTLETVSVWADCAKSVSTKDGVHFSYQSTARFAECAVFDTPEQHQRFEHFVSANWAQCGKAHGNEWCHNQYHYTDVAHLRDHYDLKFAGTQPHDVVHAISAAIAVLKGQPAPFPFQIADKREALMLLAHYVGDLHQPLHVESVYLDEHGHDVDPDEHGLDPRTDTAGGNLILDGSKRLHAWWDDIPRNLSVSGDSFAQMVQQARQVSVSPGDIQQWSTLWASEVIQTGKVAFDQLSFAARVQPEQAASTPSWNVTGLDDAYRLRAEQHKQAQLAVAGARLAQVLQAIWPDPVVKMPAQVASQPVMLRLIAFNDFHGNLESGQLNLELSDPLQPSQRMRVPVGGAAALAGLVQRLRQGAPHSLLVSTGDLLGASPLVSTLFKHESTVAVMNQIGLQASVVGNHEFDAGLPELLRLAKGGCAVTTPDVAVTSCAQGRYEGMHFPLLAANVRQTQDGKTPLAPYVVKRFGGIPVGIIGVVTRDTPNMVNPTAIRGLRFDDEAQAVNRSAAQLRKQGVRAIVLLAHEGGEIGTVATPADWNDSSCPQARGPIFDIAQQVSPDVDVILSAHTHKGYRCMLNGRLIIQSTSFGRGVSVVDLALNPRTRDIDRARTHSINLPVVNDATDVALRARIARTLPAPYNAVLMATRSDADIQQMVSRFSTMVAPKANRPVGQILGAFTCEDQQSDCRAGRLLADAQLAVTAAADQGGAQIVFTNAGGVRSEWPCQAPGPCLVTFGQVFAMQPFGSSLVVMTLSGAQIKAALEAQYKPDQAYPAFLQPSQGFTYTWQASAPVGDKVRDMRLNGQPIEAPVLYRVTVNSFLAEGGDGFVVFKQGSARRSGGLDIDALLDFLKPSLRDDKAAVIPMDAPRITWAP